MVDHSALKTQLRDLDVEMLSPTERTALLAEMTAHIGAADPELRDELIYGTLAGWIVEEELSDAEVWTLLETCLDDDHLFFDIGSSGDDAVFKRSFSVLYVAAALHRHNQTPFLSESEIQRIVTRVLQYGRQERDRRGFVEQKGWAHAPAHLADALDELAQCQGVGSDELEAILDVVRVHTRTNETVYTHGEDDRLVTALLRVLERGVLADQTVCDWVSSLGDGLSSPDAWLENSNSRTNVKAVLSSLYCRSVGVNADESIRNCILETRREVTGFE